MKTEKQIIAESIKGIIAYALYVPDESVTEDSDLRKDLGADSLDIIDITTKLESKFDIDIEDEEIGRFTTVDSVVELVSEKVRGGAKDD